jgi:uncharacterized protein
MRRRSIVFALATVFPAIGSGDAQETEPRARPPEIMAGGEGMRTVPADRASIIISVETRAPTPNAAGALNATRNAAIRAAIAAVGVPKDDITTSGYMVYPARREPQYGPPLNIRDTGYVANNSVRVTLRRPDQLGLIGRVIDTALAAGATYIAGVRYEARRTTDAEREALADAVADARSRAEAIARAAGGSLGDLIDVSTSPRGAGVEYAAAARSASIRMGGDPTMITSGEIEVRQYVTTRWRFVPGRR